MPHHERRVHSDAVSLVARALLGERPRSAAVGIEHGGRYSLKEDRRRPLELVPIQPIVRVRMHVDETRRDVELSRLDDDPRLGALQAAHGDDASVADSDIGAVPGITRAVENAPSVDEDVEALLRGGRGGSRQNQQKSQSMHGSPFAGGAYHRRPHRCGYNLYGATVTRASPEIAVGSKEATS
jgi:hypothetical protein